MPRKPRFFVSDVPIHAIVRGNNRQVVFVDNEDREKYLSILSESSIRYDTRIHAYVFMDNHVHLLISSKEGVNISRFMQHLGRKYVPYFNSKYSKTGTLWEGRFKASLIDDEAYLLSCYRYIELNPVRAGMVKGPELYTWSSYQVNAIGVESALIKPHALYLSLGLDKKERMSAYKSGFELLIDEEVIKDIRSSVQTGTPLGSGLFKDKIEKLLKVKVGYSKRGRPFNEQ